MESGIGEYWRRRLWPTTGKCYVPAQKYGPRSLTLTDVFSLLMIWVFGILLALFVFIVELIIGLMKMRFKNRCNHIFLKSIAANSNSSAETGRNGQ